MVASLWAQGGKAVEAQAEESKIDSTQRPKADKTPSDDYQTFDEEVPRRTWRVAAKDATACSRPVPR